jgi:hypothetical protein
MCSRARFTFSQSAVDIPKKAANTTGDVITDGQLSIVELGATKPNLLTPRTPPSKPVQHRQVNESGQHHLGSRQRPMNRRLCIQVP